MTQTKAYLYHGRNGVITSKVLLEGIPHVPMVELKADYGMILTNGSKFASRITLLVEDAELWHEIPQPDNGQDK